MPDLCAAADLRATPSPRPDLRLLPWLRSIRRRDAHARPLRHRELHALLTSAPQRAPCAAADLCAGVELRNDEPPFVQAIALKAHVASLCFKCFRCFRGMLQVFYIDVAKIDRDVAHVAMTIHVCFKCMFQMFHLF